jgi:hypothetical protein
MTQDSSKQSEPMGRRKRTSEVVDKTDLGAEPQPKNYLSETVLRIHCGPEDVTTDRFGEVPGGMRLHVRYRGGDITLSKRDSNAGSKRNPQKGRVLSGIDWVFLRRDAVAVFDTRLTFRVKDEEDVFVFDAVISGIVDLAQPAASSEERLETYRRWNQIQGTLHVALPVRFETSGPNQDWAAKRYQISAEKFAAYSYLATNQFLALGTVDVAPNTIKQVQLDVKMVLPRGA